VSAAVATAGSRNSIDLAAAAMMLGLTFSWGVNSVAAKVSYTGYDPVFISIMRSVIGGACVVAWCRWRGIPLFARDGSLGAGVAVGLLFGVEFLLLYIGLERTTVARNTLLVNAMPFWMLLGGHFLLGEAVTLRKFFGLVLAFAGLVLVFGDKLGSYQGSMLTGDLLSLVAGIAWAGTNILIKRTNLTSVPAEKLLLYQLVGAAVVGLVVMPFSDVPVRSFALAPTAALLFQAMYVVAFTYVLWFWMLGRYPASSLASFTFLTPVFGVLSGALLLGEPLSINIFLALALVVAGLIIVNRPARRQIAGEVPDA
jgi:drug/metabolite transporter (DMT)-like permease